MDRRQQISRSDLENVNRSAAQALTMDWQAGFRSMAIGYHHVPRSAIAPVHEDVAWTEGATAVSASRVA